MPRQTLRLNLSSEVEEGYIKAAFANAQEPVYITITNRNGSVLYEEISRDQQNYARRFNVSGLEKGEQVIVSISHGNRTFRQLYGIQ